MKEPKKLIADLRSGVISHQDFCGLFENYWNFKADKEHIDDKLRKKFDDLFDCVVMYSPFPEDRAEYEGYSSEFDIDELLQKLFPVDVLEE